MDSSASEQTQSSQTTTTSQYSTVESLLATYDSQITQIISQIPYPTTKSTVLFPPQNVFKPVWKPRELDSNSLSINSKKTENHYGNNQQRIIRYNVDFISEIEQDSVEIPDNNTKIKWF
jgi:hypothetical protein